MKEAETITIPRHIIKFVIEGYIRSILSDLNSKYPNPLFSEDFCDLDTQQLYVAEIKHNTAAEIVQIMRIKKAKLQDVKYLRSNDIKVEFEDTK